MFYVLDPYHDDGQAEGMCFSVPKGVKLPSSLRNIFKELSSDTEIKAPTHGHLGVFYDVFDVFMMLFMIV